MTDLLPVPITGEALDLHAPDDELAGWVDRIKEIKAELTDIQAKISEELLARMDADASWTIHTDRFKITGQSPNPKEEWNEERLRSVLAKLVADGKVSPRAAKKAVKTEVTYKPVVAGLKALRKVLKGEDLAALESCVEPVPPTRRIRVEFER